MTTAFTSFIGRVSGDLLDTDFDRWSVVEHIVNINSGINQLVTFKPSAYITTSVFQLVAGIRQSLPSGAVELVRISRNMGLDGSTDGPGILPVTMKDFNELHPGWREDATDAEVIHYMFNDQDRTAFEVYPAQPSSNMGYVEAMYSTIPDKIEYDDNIPLGDEYVEALVNYMMFAAYKRNAASSAFDAERAVAFWNLFLSQIGRKDLIENQYPKRRRDPYGNTNQSVS